MRCHRLGAIAFPSAPEHSIGQSTLISRFFHRARPWCAILAVLVLLSARIASAQAVKGCLLGNVVDQAGLPLSRATIAISGANTYIAYTTRTNHSRYHLLSNLYDG